MNNFKHIIAAALMIVGLAAQGQNHVPKTKWKIHFPKEVVVIGIGDEGQRWVAYAGRGTVNAIVFAGQTMVAEVYEVETGEISQLTIETGNHRKEEWVFVSHEEIKLSKTIEIK